MTWTEALILGIIQGLTEFLPISSSGHLEIGTYLLNIQVKDHLLFAIIVHLATALATIVVFRENILSFTKDIVKFQWNTSTKYFAKIGLSMIPVFIVGMFFKDRITSFFSSNLLLVGSMLLITGSLLLFAHFRKDGTKSVDFVSSFIIGLAQAVAVIPGISRSGATISTALILGIERSRAAQFSFLMVLFPIIGASILMIKDYATNLPQYEIKPIVLLVGFISAFLSGFIACKWMITMIRKGILIPLSVYCFIIGLIAIISFI